MALLWLTCSKERHRETILSLYFLRIITIYILYLSVIHISFSSCLFSFFYIASIFVLFPTSKSFLVDWLVQFILKKREAFLFFFILVVETSPWRKLYNSWGYICSLVGPTASVLYRKKSTSSTAVLFDLWQCF